MVTSEVSGVFANHEKTVKQEVLELIKFEKERNIGLIIMIHFVKV